MTLEKDRFKNISSADDRDIFVEHLRECSTKTLNPYIILLRRGRRGGEFHGNDR